MVKGMTIGVNEDTLGAILKASIAQFISLEITKSNSAATFGRGDASRESRSVNRYLPWLSSPPANTAAQGWIQLKYLDLFLKLRGQNFAIFYPPPPCMDSFYTLTVDKNRLF